MAKQQNIPGGLEGLTALNLGNEQITLDEEKAKSMEKQQNETNEKAAPNLGWLFYFDYFYGMDVDADGRGILNGDRNSRLFAANLKDYERFFKEIFPPLGKTEHAIRLKTTYPGLLIGSGYQHETGAEGELKLGFFFDHTSGLPVIPGSSVKGVLRSVFYHQEFMMDLIKSLFNKDISEDDVKKMATEIFGPAPKDHLPASQSISPMCRDVFFDAVPEKSHHKNLSPANGNLLANDFITPHINRKNKTMSPFTNPVPIQFLKVLPEVVFRFQFDLKPSEKFSFLDEKGKRKLFLEILTTLGIGAKTNVGYGQFTEVKK